MIIVIQELIEASMSGNCAYAFGASSSCMIIVIQKLVEALMSGNCSDALALQPIV